ncbi:hypothetical protein ACH5RR_009749 [Cinchona calisaya]|uniref:Uncharacterized protein n=1 Tax=Cinchona calisaya TaxID=153742 RepID=A0ABD3AFC5_9GENT
MADHHNIINSCGRGRSKAQSNLQKILQTISGNQFSSTNSSIQSSQSTATFSELINVSSESDSLEMGPTKKVKFDVDLNLSPPPETETHQEDYQPAEINGAGEGCNATLRLESGDSNEKIEADPHPDEEMSQREEKSKGIGKFEALLDVVQIVSGEGGSSSEPMETELTADGINGQRIAEEETETEVAAVAAAEEEEQLSVSVSVSVSPAPVMRTKRGRAQVLPYKFRDSVVEPIGSMSSRHRRSSSSSTHVPTKRGSR